MGALTRTFPPELVDRVVAMTDTREVRRRLLPSRFVVYFVLALWLFRGRNCGYGQVMIKLVDGLYHRRRARDLLDGVVPDPDGWVGGGSVAYAVRFRRGPGRRRRRGGCVLPRVAGGVGRRLQHCVPDTTGNARYFGRPSNGTRDGAFLQVRWLAAAESGTGALIGATIGAYTVGEQTQFRDLLSAFGPDMMVLADRNFLSHTLRPRRARHRGAHPVAGLGVVSAGPDAGPGRRQLPGQTQSGA
jgi:hypothetical protein